MKLKFKRRLGILKKQSLFLGKRCSTSYFFHGLPDSNENWTEGHRGPIPVIFKKRRIHLDEFIIRETGGVFDGCERGDDDGDDVDVP